jgi:CRP-like cAMP-binding protein
MPQKNSSLIDRISRFQKESGAPPGLSVAVEGLLSPRYTQKPKKKLTAGNDKLPSFISLQRPSKKLSLPDKDTKKQTESEPDSTFGEQKEQVVETEERYQPAPPQKESIESPTEEKTQPVQTQTYMASSFRDRIVMFSKAAAPPTDLMRGRPEGFLSPRHMKRLVVVKEDAEIKKEETITIPAEASPVKAPAPPIKPVENPAESTPSVILDKAKAAESIVDHIDKFNTFHDRRNRLKATKSKVLGEKQKVASKRNIFKAITAQVEDLSSFRIPRFPKDSSQTKIIKTALKKNFVFDDLEENDIQRFVEAFQNVKIANGDTIIKQGDPGDYFYVVANGTVTFHVNNNEVGTAGKGNSFGHLALLFTCPRAATVKAATQPTSLFRVDQKTFRYIMQSQTKKSANEKEKLLRDIAFLSHLNTGDMQRLCSVMTPHLFNTGDCIVKKGEQGKSFYVLQEGRVRVTDIFVGNTHYENVTLGPGDHFGEGALISTEPRAANVIALTQGTAFSIDRETFTKVLGDFSRLISKAQDRQRLVSSGDTKLLGSCMYYLNHIVAFPNTGGYKAIQGRRLDRGRSECSRDPHRR